MRHASNRWRCWRTHLEWAAYFSCFRSYVSHICLLPSFLSASFRIIYTYHIYYPCLSPPILLNSCLSAWASRGPGQELIPASGSSPFFQPWPPAGTIHFSCSLEEKHTEIKKKRTWQETHSLSCILVECIINWFRLQTIVLEIKEKRENTRNSLNKLLCD